MATDSSLRETVLDLVRGLGDDGAAIAPDTVLSEIGFDSLAYAELAAALQEDREIDLVDGGPVCPRTVSDILELVESASSRSEAPLSVRPGMGRMQRGASLVAGGLVRWWFHVEVRGAEHMPSEGPVVLCMNHESMLDIPVAVVASPRPVTFMAKRELFESRAGARIFHALGGFSVDREAFDLRAIRTALDVVGRGQVLGMYPEGTRTPGTLLPFLRGGAWIALHAGAPLLPAAIVGTDAAMPPGSKVPNRVRVRMSFGKPIPVDAVDDPAKRRAEAVRLTAELRSSIEELLAATA